MHKRQVQNFNNSYKEEKKNYEKKKKFENVTLCPEILFQV